MNLPKGLSALVCSLVLFAPLETSAEGTESGFVFVNPGTTGERLFVTSTGSAVAPAGGPAVLVPGMETEVTVSEASNLMVQVDFRDSLSCPQMQCCTDGVVRLELDGEVVASRLIPGRSFGNLAAVESHTIDFLSPPLAQGAHQVRVLVDSTSVEIGESSSCVGSGDGPLDPLEARMVILELRKKSHHSPPSCGVGGGAAALLVLPFLRIRRRRWGSTHHESRTGRAAA